MVTWRNRPINSLSAAELRHALDDAMHEIAWSRSAPSSTSFFYALLISFSAGAVVSATAILISAALS